MKKRSSTTASNTRKTSPKKNASKSASAASPDRRANAVTPTGAKKMPAPPHGNVPCEYVTVLTDLQQLIADSRRRALATVNRELVYLYWNIGRVIVRQQETAQWGDAVVEQLAKDLRMTFPDMKGLSSPNVWKMRQFYLACRELDAWMSAAFPIDQHAGSQRCHREEHPSTSEHVRAARSHIPAQAKGVARAQRQLPVPREILSTLSRESGPHGSEPEILSTLSRELTSAVLVGLVAQLSWSQHTEILAASTDPAERYFYMAMSARERWSIRELRRQIHSALFLRYTSVRRDPEKCLPAEAESGDLLPFKDHYVLEFLGLGDEHSERELRKAILANLRDFFLEFGRDLTFVGEEYPLTIGNDTFYIDLVFFHRRLQCLIAVDLKIGSFQPEYVGKSLFYVTGLDEQIRLPHENPSIGLILCRDADHAQVRIALTPAAKKVGVATYQTALPDLRLIRQRLEQFVIPQETP